MKDKDFEPTLTNCLCPPTHTPQVRSLCSEQPLADIYAVFEDHVARLVAENQTLRQRNVALELKEDSGAWQTPQVGGTALHHIHHSI